MTVGAAARRRSSLAAAAACAVVLLGCAAGPDLRAANDGLLVFGARLGAAGVPVGLAGMPAEESPCLNGRDFAYEEQGLLIGYTHGGRLRKVVTRNPETSIYGIHPGDALEDALPKALGAGYAETTTRHRYTGACCVLTLSVDEVGRVFSLMLELRD